MTRIVREEVPQPAQPSRHGTRAVVSMAVLAALAVLALGTLSRAGPGGSPIAVQFTQFTTGAVAGPPSASSTHSATPSASPTPTLSPSPSVQASPVPLPLDAGQWFVDRHATKPRFYNASCPVIRASYNCEDDPRAAKNGFAWQLVWQPHASIRAQALDDAVEAAGGLIGAMSRAANRTCKRPQPSSVREVTNVLMMGTSYVRQAFEALVCRYSAQVTGGRVTTKLCEIKSEMHHNPAFALKHPLRPTCAVTTKLPVQEFGKMTMHPQCHDKKTTLAFFYKDRSKAPRQQLPLCGDNVAMREFRQGKKVLRLHYVYRPYMYPAKDLPGVLKNLLDLQLQDVDVLLGMDNFGLATDYRAKQFLKELRQQSRCTGEPEVVAFDAVYARLLNPLAIKSLGNVVNKAHPPSRTTHMCLPGPPDDEMTLWLLSLATGLPFAKDSSAGVDAKRAWETALSLARHP